MTETSESEWEPASDEDLHSDEAQEDAGRSGSESDVSDEAVEPVSEGDGLFADDSSADPVQEADRLSHQDCCVVKHFEGKIVRLQDLLRSRSSMSHSEKKASNFTSLSLYASFWPRENLEKPASGSALATIRPSWVKRARTQGSIASGPHGNVNNKHAKVYDELLLAEWLQEFANGVGDVVPVRVRLRKQASEFTKHYYSYENYTLLHSHVTWEMVRMEFLQYIFDNDVVTEESFLTTFKRILSKR